MCMAAFRDKAGKTDTKTDEIDSQIGALLSFFTAGKMAPGDFCLVHAHQTCRSGIQDVYKMTN